MEAEKKERKDWRRGGTGRKGRKTGRESCVVDSKSTPENSMPPGTLFVKVSNPLE